MAGSKGAARSVARAVSMERSSLALVFVVAMTACGGSTADVPDGPSQRPAPGGVGGSPGSGGAAAPRAPAETCNGLDDDADGQVDVGSRAGPCREACAGPSIAALAAGLRLPRPGDRTVPEDEGSTIPELVETSTIPSFCAEPPEGLRGPIDVEVGCGETLVVGREGLRARSLRVAPGGVVRVREDARIDLEDTLLVCPGATIQAGADPVRGPVKDTSTLNARSLALRARVALVLGAIESRGARVLEAEVRGGDGGALDVEVERLLFAGVLDASASAPTYRGEKGGDMRVVATKESFFSGTVRSNNGANVLVQVPVCCH